MFAETTLLRKNRHEKQVRRNHTSPSLVTSTTILGTTLPHLSHKVRVKMGPGMAQKIFVPKNIKRNA